jgi:hypothetical protein
LSFFGMVHISLLTETLDYHPDDPRVVTTGTYFRQNFGPCCTTTIHMSGWRRASIAAG